MTPAQIVRDAIASSAGYRRRWDLRTKSAVEFAELCRLFSEENPSRVAEYDEFAEYGGVIEQGRQWQVFLVLERT